MYSVYGYLSFQQNDRLFYEISSETMTSVDEALQWNDAFRGTEVDSADVQIVEGDRVSTDMFRVAMPDIWYSQIDALGQSFVISSDVVRDVRIGRDSMVLFDRTRAIGVPHPLSYKRGTIGSISLVGLNIPVSRFGMRIVVDRYRLTFDDAHTVFVDLEPGATIVRTVMITANQTGSAYAVRTCCYKRVSHAQTSVINVQ